MADFSLRHGGGSILKVGTGDAGYMTAVNGAASAHVKGAWVQLVASSAYAASAIILTLLQNQFDRTLTDLGVGGAGSEVVIVPNVMEFGGGKDRARHQYTVWPVSIPAGSRIAARTQNDIGSTRGIFALAYLVPQSLHRTTESVNRVLAYGALTASTRGTTVTVGFSGAKGSWVELTASTSRPMKSFYLRLGNDHASGPAAVYALDIGVGAAASETVILADVPLVQNSNPQSLTPQYLGPFFVDIPEGTRIAARAATDVGSGNVDFDIILYGVG